MSEEQDGPILHETVRPQTIPVEYYQQMEEPRGVEPLFLG